MYILGLSAFYHDSAAALVLDGKIVAAVQEERFTRKKHDSSYPNNAIRYCLESEGITLSEIDSVVFYDKPFLKFERLLETYVAFAPRGYQSFKTTIPVWIKEKLFQKDLLRKKLASCEEGFDWENKLLFSEHHFSHAASAFYPSPFDEAVVLTMDGVGEWTTSSVSLGCGDQLEIQKEQNFPHSLGLLYSAFTYYTGFKVNSGEYKLMGLAPYGEAKYAQKIIDELMDLKEDGSFRLNMDYFEYCTGLKMTSKKFDQLFGQSARIPEKEELTQFHMDVAASIQAVTEEVMLRIVRSLAKEYPIPNLCLAGGVALNCVANGKILKDKCFENVWVQPAAGDAGGALGAALVGWHVFHEGKRYKPRNGGDSMQGAYLGPSLEQGEITVYLDEIGAVYEVLDDEALFEATALALQQEKAIGWVQGRMEFGPRALGGRSILGDPRSPKMQKTLNLKVKYRESFRPFAPSVLAEDVSDWFDFEGESPYMLMVSEVNSNIKRNMTPEEESLFGIEKLNIARSDLPAITHIDYSARIQTVHQETNPRYHRLLSKFKQKTGCPVLINTSFNVRGEPIVCTTEDAYRCFMGTEMDVLVIGNCILHKERQNVDLKINYKDAFALD